MPRLHAQEFLASCKVLFDCGMDAGDNAQGIWETNIFGKTIEQIVDDGIYEKNTQHDTGSMKRFFYIGKVHE